MKKRPSAISAALLCIHCINRLVPPDQFAAKMQDYLVKALPMRVLEKLSSGIFPDTMEGLGLDGYSMDHWLGSHPSMVPCDWEKGIPWKKGAFSNTTTLHGWGFDLTKHDHIMKDDTLRRKEFSFLAGLLVKWYMLYGELPPTESWVYQVYPDGEHWQQEGPGFVKDFVVT
jgi:hypothetical protein